jgi:hypothetical protein
LDVALLAAALEPDDEAGPEVLAAPEPDEVREDPEAELPLVDELRAEVAVVLPTTNWAVSMPLPTDE